MKSNLKTYLRALLPALLLALLPTGCVQSGEGPCDTPDGGDAMSLRMILSVDEGSSSRAPQGDYDPGTGYENYIDLAGGDFFAAIYNPDDKLCFIAHDMTLTPIAATGESAKRYMLQFPVTKAEFESMTGEGNTKSFKILLLANWRNNYPDATAAADLKSAFTADNAEKYAISYSDAFAGPVLGREDKIAMFGVKEYNNIEMYDWQATQLRDQINLIRSVAKVEVSLESTMLEAENGPLELQEVDISPYSLKAAPAPFGVTKESDYKHDSFASDYTAKPSTLVTWTSLTGARKLSVIPSTQGANPTYAAYIPEYVNLNDDGTAKQDRSQISVKILDKSTNETIEASFDFAEYRQEGGVSVPEKYLDVLRNVKYIFEVRRSAVDVNVTLKVVPWNFTRLEEIPL